MIESQQVQDGGVHIVNMHAILDGVIAEFIGCAVDEPRLNPAARHPHRIAVGIVVATVSGLRNRRAAEFSTPNN